MANILPTTILIVIWSGSFLISLIPYMALRSLGLPLEILSFFLMPIVFVTTFPTLAGLFGLRSQRGIRTGKFPREPLHPVYLHRRIYGLCWTQLYYFKPVYACILAVPVLKAYVFRLFGYKGSTNFTIYPDTWVRDLPILSVGEGAYLSNRATIGTNMCLSDGTIYVAPIHVGDGGIVGHLAMLAPGVKVGKKAEVGVGCAIGIKVKIGEGASIKPSTTLNHGAVIGDNADIGTMSFLGLRCEIGSGVKLPAGSSIPAGAVLKTQADVDQYHSSESQKLREHVDGISHFMVQQVHGS